MSRIVIFTGKGGVGKTSIAAAHALASAEEGKKTLLVSTDAAHNIGDLFQQKVGEAIVSVMPMMDAVELNPDSIMQKEYPELLEAVGQMLAPDGMRLDCPEDLLAAMGVQSLFSLMKIEELHRKNQYERIIVDCAPTGETLSLLKLPELLSWYMEKFFPVGKIALRIMSPASEKMLGVKLPGEKAMADAEKLFGRLMALQKLLKDGRTTSVRLVCIPEKMVVEETKRSYMYLNLYHFKVDAVYVNRVLPDDTGSGFMARWHDIQQGYLNELEQIFVNIPITKIPWYSKEVRGMEAVRRLYSENLMQDGLFAAKNCEEGETYTACGEDYILNMKLPGACAEQVKVQREGKDLLIKIGNFNRCIPLPNTFREYSVGELQVEDGVLKLRFCRNCHD